MPITVILDVDNTLRMKDLRPRVLNQTLIDQLKAHDVKEVYLLTNMDLSDSDPDIREFQSDQERLTRKFIIEELKRQGIKVKSVLTVADVEYNQGPGAAYRDFYAAADVAITKEEHQAIQARWQSYSEQPYQKAIVRPTSEELPAFLKEKAFRYFLAHTKKEDIGTLLYADDDISCLDRINTIAQSHIIPTTVIFVDPEHFQTGAERKKYNAMLQEAHPFGKVLARYRPFVGNHFWSLHTPAGLDAAEKLVERVNALEPEERFDEVMKFLAQGENFRQEQHSFRAILLAHLLGRDISQDAVLREVAMGYKVHLDYYRQHPPGTVSTPSTLSAEDFQLLDSSDGLSSSSPSLNTSSASESDEDYMGDIPDSPKFS